MLASRRNGAAEECVKQFARNPEGIKTTTNFDDVINHPEINAIYIPLANEEHTEVALKAIAQKKHVLIEKPMALTKQEVKSITQAAKDNNVIVMEGFMYVFHPQFDFILDFINSGKLGKFNTRIACFPFQFSQLDTIGSIDQLKMVGVLYGILALTQFIHFGK